MRSNRVYADISLQPGSEVTLPEGPSRHLGQVLRLRVGDELVVFNKYSHAQIARVPVGDRPMLAVRLHVPQGNPPSPYVYVSNYDDGTVGVVDVGTWQMIDEIPVGGETIGPWGLMAMPDGERVYVVNQGQSTVSVVGY